MVLIVLIDLLVIVALSYTAARKGVEAALPVFVFVVVLMPGESLISIPGLFTVTTQRVALGTLAVLYLIYSRRGRVPVPAGVPLKRLLLLYVLWCGVSTVNSVVISTSVKYMLSQVLEYFLMYVIFIKTITRTETVQKILAAMVLGVSVACIFGAIEAYQGWSVVQLFPAQTYRFSYWAGATGQSERGIRISSTFSNPILFASGIAFALIDTFYLLTVAKTNRSRVLLWIGILLMFMCVYKTGSRGPWIATAAGMCALFLLPRPGMRRNMGILIFLMVVVLIARPGVYDSLASIYIGTVTHDPNSILANSYEYRFALWRVGWHALARSPARELWGYGMESFFSLHLVEPFGNNPAYPFYSCDSSWVQSMVETGYVGLALFIALLLTPAWIAFRQWVGSVRLRDYLYFVLLINMVQYYFMMFSVGLYSWGQTGYMLWMWIAIAMAYRSVARNEHSRKRIMQAPRTEPQVFAASRSRTRGRRLAMPATILS